MRTMWTFVMYYNCNEDLDLVRSTVCLHVSVSLFLEPSGLMYT